MALTDIPRGTHSEAEIAAMQVRRLTAKVLAEASRALAGIRREVQGKRASVAAELGPDAAAMLTVYNNLKAAVKVGTGITPQGIPDA